MMESCSLLPLVCRFDSLSLGEWIKDFGRCEGCRSSQSVVVCLQAGTIRVGPASPFSSPLQQEYSNSRPASLVRFSTQRMQVRLPVPRTISCHHMSSFRRAWTRFVPNTTRTSCPPCPAHLSSQHGSLFSQFVKLRLLLSVTNR